MRLRLPMPVEEVQIQSIDSSVNNLGTAVEVRSSREAHTFLVNKAPKGNEVIVDRFLHRGHCSTVYLEYGRREENYRERHWHKKVGERPRPLVQRRGVLVRLSLCAHIYAYVRGFKLLPKSRNWTQEKLEAIEIGILHIHICI